MDLTLKSVLDTPLPADLLAPLPQAKWQARGGRRPPPGASEWGSSGNYYDVMKVVKKPLATLTKRVPNGR